jgi:hypothetical protein
MLAYTRAVARRARAERGAAGAAREWSCLEEDAEGGNVRIAQIEARIAAPRQTQKRGFVAPRPSVFSAASRYSIFHACIAASVPFR